MDGTFEVERQKKHPTLHLGIADLRLYWRLSLKNFWLRRGYRILYWRLYGSRGTQIGGHWRLSASKNFGRPAAREAKFAAGLRPGR